jgi:hypothetical protein
MSMAEYIDRGELLKELERFPHLGTAVSIVRGMKEADVAPVVRCKDCKHLMFSDCYGECTKALFSIVSPNDFCSYGERKEQE